jgi:hypothetical protein
MSLIDYLAIISFGLFVIGLSLLIIAGIAFDHSLWEVDKNHPGMAPSRAPQTGGLRLSTLCRPPGHALAIGHLFG